MTGSDVQVSPTTPKPGEGLGGLRLPRAHWSFLKPAIGGGRGSSLNSNITNGSLPRPQECPLGKVSCDTAGCLMTIGGECSERNQIPSPLSIPDLPRLGQAITLNSKKSNSHSRPRVGKSGEAGSAGTFLGTGSAVHLARGTKPDLVPNLPALNCWEVKNSPCSPGQTPGAEGPRAAVCPARHHLALGSGTMWLQDQFNQGAI